MTGDEAPDLRGVAADAGAGRELAEVAIGADVDVRHLARLDAVGAVLIIAAEDMNHAVAVKGGQGDLEPVSVDDKADLASGGELADIASVAALVAAHAVTHILRVAVQAVPKRRGDDFRHVVEFHILKDHLTTSFRDYCTL